LWKLATNPNSRSQVQSWCRIQQGKHEITSARELNNISIH